MLLHYLMGLPQNDLFLSFLTLFSTLLLSVATPVFGETLNCSITRTFAHTGTQQRANKVTHNHTDLYAIARWVWPHEHHCQYQQTDLYFQCEDDYTRISTVGMHWCKHWQLTAHIIMPQRSSFSSPRLWNTHKPRPWTHIYADAFIFIAVSDHDDEKSGARKPAVTMVTWS